MRRFFFALSLLAAAWLMVGGSLAQGPGAQRPLGPDDDGAVLKLPFDSTPTRPAPPAGTPQPAPPQSPPAARPQFPSNPFPGNSLPGNPLEGKAPGNAPNYAEQLFGGKGGPAGLENPGDPINLIPNEKPDINRDIAITPSVGQWVIFIESYHGEKAQMLARQMVAELREAFKLPAYSFNFGSEERKKEYERVKGIIDKHKEYLRVNNLPSDHPCRVRFMRIEEQVGVMVGGYPTDEAARKALDQVRRLKPPDPKKVQMARTVAATTDPKTGQVVEQKEVFVNPFQRTFVSRNPTVKHERPAEWDTMDIASLKRLNAEEPYSLLSCKKPLTLAIKQFSTPSVVQTKASTGILDNIFKGKSSERQDAAALNARNMAEALRKIKLDSYVLHTKHCSVVTVGAFDSLEDPNLRATQNLIDTRLKNELGKVGLELFATPMPMKVPR